MKPEKSILKTPKGEIEYVLRRSRRKTISVAIKDDAEIVVGAPLWVEVSRVKQFLKEKSSWILRKQAEFSQKNDFLKKRAFDHGANFLFLGDKYPLTITENGHKAEIIFSQSGWQLQLSQGLDQKSREETIKEILIDWYRVQAKEVFGGRVFHFARMLKVEPQEIVVRTQKRLWGSCHHHSRKIHLNWQLVLSPLEVIDYVVVHELCHLLVPNHSQRFWGKVEAILPDFKKRKAWLREHGWQMRIF